jgi:hypothetical protein
MLFKIRTQEQYKLSRGPFREDVSRQFCTMHATQHVAWDDVDDGINNTSCVNTQGRLFILRTYAFRS